MEIYKMTSKTPFLITCKPGKRNRTCIIKAEDEEYSKQIKGNQFKAPKFRCNTIFNPKGNQILFKTSKTKINQNHCVLCNKEYKGIMALRKHLDSHNQKKRKKKMFYTISNYIQARKKKVFKKILYKVIKFKRVIHFKISKTALTPNEGKNKKGNTNSAKTIFNITKVSKNNIILESSIFKITKVDKSEK